MTQVQINGEWRELLGVHERGEWRIYVYVNYRGNASNFIQSWSSLPLPTRPAPEDATKTADGDGWEIGSTGKTLKPFYVSKQCCDGALEFICSDGTVTDDPCHRHIEFPTRADAEAALAKWREKQQPKMRFGEDPGVKIAEVPNEPTLADEAKKAEDLLRRYAKHLSKEYDNSLPEQVCSAVADALASLVRRLAEKEQEARK